MHAIILVVHGIAIQQALISFVEAASFRGEPVGIADPQPVNVTAALFEESQPVPYDRLCIRNTGRMCEAAMNPEKTVVDYLGQCDPTSHEHCSTGKSFPAGYCVCMPGHCADGKGRCVKEKSILSPSIFHISTQQFGGSQILYMLKNGKVMMGTPANPAQAQWRIVVTPDKVLKLFTMAYPYRYMDSYEHCIRFAETTKCQTLVGSSINPPARDTGWKLDHSGVYDESASGFAEHGEYVFLRDFYSSKNLYVHHLTREVLLCSPSDYDCPGPYGSLMFTPTIHGHLEIPISYPPPTPVMLVFQWIGLGLIIIIALFLCVMNARLDNKITHLDDNILTGPTHFVRAIVMCELCGHRSRR